jgi:autotransporter translocation and assembly factor TamB
MMRWLTTVLAFILTFCFLISASVILLSQSEKGSRFVLDAAKIFIPGKFNFSRVSGALNQHFTVEEINYEYKDIDITLQKFDILWHPQLLFKHNLFIQNITLTGLNVKKWKFNSNADHSSKLTFLKRITIQHFALNSFTANANFYLPQSINDPLKKIQFNADGSFNFSSPQNLSLTALVYSTHNIAKINIMHTAENKNIQWTVNISDLSQWIPTTKGILYSQGYCKNNQLTASLQAKNITYQQQAINQANLLLTGTFQHQQLSFAVSAPKRKLSAKISSQYDGKKITGQLNQLMLTDAQWGHWHLMHNAQFSIAHEDYLLKQFAIKSATATYIMDAAWTPAKFVLKQRGNYTLESLGLHLYCPEAIVTSDNKKLNFTVRLISGKGEVRLLGNASLGQHFQLQVKVKGKNFLAANTSEYRIVTSPDLIFSGNPAHWKLQGQLEIPMADIDLPDADQKAITLPSDVVFVNSLPSTQHKNNQHTDFLQNLSANISLTIPHSITVQAQGLSAKIKGSLQLKDTAQTLPTAVGILTIAYGTYKVYGQTLDIRNGRLLFNHSLVSNPFLDIQAAKKIHIENTGSLQVPVPLQNQSNSLNAPVQIGNLSSLPSVMVIGVNATGTLENPNLVLFSEPSILSKSDILSYLLLGHPANALSFTDAKFLLESSSLMKLNAFDMGQVSNQIQNHLGIDEAKISSINYINPTTGALQQTTAFMLKKTLSPQFYISYSIGLFDPINIFTLHYLLSKKWSVEAASSTFGNSADLIYSVDRD